MSEISSNHNKLFKVVYGVDDCLGVYADIISGQQGTGFDQSPEWFEAYLAHVSGRPENVLLASVTDGAGTHPLLGMLLLREVSGWLSIRHLNALANYYTVQYLPALRAGGPSLGDLVPYFVSSLKGGALEWDEISLEPMAGETKFFAELCRSLEAAKLPYTATVAYVNWYLPLEGKGYEAYVQSLPSRLRNTLKRKKKKLERECKSSISILSTISTSREIEKAIRDYECVYRKSWKGEEGHPAFIRAIIRQFALKGWLRLGILYIDHIPVAAQLWFVKDGVASIFKLSYDADYANYSVGTILTAAMMKQAMDIDQVREVDFLTGDDTYKKDWMTHSRLRYRIRVFNRRSWRGWLLALWNRKCKVLIGNT